MFKILLENNYDNILREDARNIIKEDRKQYQDIIDFVLKFINTNKLLISNINILLNKQEYWDSIDIFTLNIDEISKSLISQLCRNFDKLFFLKIVSEDKEYFIEYNLRRICTLNSIKPYKSFTLYDFISPVKHMVNNTTIYLFPYLVEIIYLYNKLYNPALASDWEDTYKDIKKIEVYVDKEIETLLKVPKSELSTYISTSGGKDIKECEKNKCKVNQDKQNMEIKKIVMDFLKNEHYILCNEFYNIENPEGVIEVISSNIEVDFKLLVNYLSKFIKYGIMYKKKSIYLPKDSQMEKYHFYIEIPFVKNIKKKHFLTIYNNTSYELINYFEKNQYKYADPITQLKFAYLSIWSSIIMQKTHGIHYEEFINHLTTKKNNIKDLRNKVNIYELKKNYTGVYLSEQISKKLALNFSGNKSNFYCHDF